MKKEFEGYFEDYDEFNTDPEKSKKYHEMILKNSEHFLEFILKPYLKKSKKED
jgi:hypothetical protein